MALGWRRLAAKKDSLRPEERAINRVFNAATSHQLKEVVFVLAPRAATLLVAIEHVLRGSQNRLVSVARPADLGKKIGEIVSLSETCKLRHIVQAHIDKL